MCQGVDVSKLYSLLNFISKYLFSIFGAIAVSYEKLYSQIKGDILCVIS